MYLGLQSFHGSQMVSDCAPSQQKKLLRKLTLFYFEIICSITALLVTFSSSLLFMFISTILGLILHSIYYFTKIIAHKAETCDYFCGRQHLTLPQCL